MSTDKVSGKDETPKVILNSAELLAGTYKVTAEDGVFTRAGFSKKGEEIELDGDTARALMNEGSIKRA
jgi:hypothetical protein